MIILRNTKTNEERPFRTIPEMLYHTKIDRHKNSLYNFFCKNKNKPYIYNNYEIFKTK